MTPAPSLFFDPRSRMAAHSFPRLRRFIHNYVARLYFHHISGIDDCYLAGMGLTRDELDFMCTLPLDLDPWPELFRRRSCHRLPGHSGTLPPFGF